MARDWRDKMTCICGWSTFNPIAEARHRHNFPLLCRKPKPKLPPIELRSNTDLKKLEIEGRTYKIRERAKHELLRRSGADYLD